MGKNRADLDHSFFPSVEVNGVPKQPGYKLSSKYLHLYSAEQRNSYRFGTTWGCVNDDRIFIFGWTILLSLQAFPSSLKHTMHCILQTRVKRQWNINTYNSFILTQWAFSLRSKFSCQTTPVLNLELNWLKNHKWTMKPADYKSIFIVRNVKLLLQKSLVSLFTDAT